MLWINHHYNYHHCYYHYYYYIVIIIITTTIIIIIIIIIHNRYNHINDGMEAFLTMIIAMGVVNQENIQQYWSTNKFNLLPVSLKLCQICMNIYMRKIYEHFNIVSLAW